MRCLNVTHCLCCISLKPAGILLGALGIAGCIYSIAMAKYEINKDFEVTEILNNEVMEHQLALKYFFAVLQLLTSTLWLFGIFTKNPHLMLPELILSFLFLLLIGLLVGLMFLVAGSSRGARLHIIAFPAYCIAGLLFHFWIVRLSLYKSMVHNGRNTDTRYMGHELNEIRTYVYTV
ncbi:uncharacterized protein LOC129570311 [Sitodiplosis mosellana]|uniref:uncharacterized protein LOC129570311 n=1 Tax=Sitodiplosis mosellana TaxID=263140 RepID=UPI0024438427|nr:uncharacterized protein LOC129570311 [Sitodiplosis mosellana]XP_055305843.1 uncharacterized protein LOC129570311 [Sitodiplosis mosellana]